MKIKITEAKSLMIMAENSKDREVVDLLESKVRELGAPESLILDKIYTLTAFQRFKNWIRYHMGL